MIIKNRFHRAALVISGLDDTAALQMIFHGREKTKFFTDKFPV